VKASKILFATDFSTIAEGALELAASLARSAGAKLLIVHVEEPPVAYTGGQFYYGIKDPAREEQQRMLEQVVPKSGGVEVEHHLLSGAPGLAICEFAEAEGVDLLVIGSHGRTGLSRVLMGSISEQIVRNAPCPVLTYKRPHEQPDS